MSGWPTIQKPYIKTPTTVKNNALSSPLVNGMEITRAKYTRQLSEWDLEWPAMPDTDLIQLRQWYKDCGGGSATFQWSDEFSNSYTVRFASDLKHESVSSTHSQVSVKLEEV